MEDKQTDRDLVTVAIEYALLDFSVPSLDIVKSKLMENYDMTLEECMDNPEPLKKILCDLYGNAYQRILDNIHIVVEDKCKREPIKNFLQVMIG